MANQSIKSAFERLWHHVILKLNNYATTESLDEHIADTSNPHNVQLSQLGVETPVSEIDEKLEKITDSVLLPQVTESDNDKVLQVIDGAWTAAEQTTQPGMNNHLSMQLEVNQVSTSRRVQRYLAGDFSDDAYIRLYGEQLEYVVGVTDGTTEQAQTTDGQLLYWEQDISSANIGGNGYPYINGERIYATTTVTSWPVIVFKYTEQVKRSTHFIDDDGTYTMDSFGTKDANGNQWGYIAHNGDGVKFVVQDAEGNDLGLIMRYDGFMDLFGMRRTKLIDLSEVPFGKLWETVDGVESEYSWTIERDEFGRIVKIIDDLDGHETQVRWWQESE